MSKPQSAGCCRAWVVTLSFPSAASGVEMMLKKNRQYHPDLKIDFDVLANYHLVEQEYKWTAPARGRNGDLLFFYFSRSAKKNAVAVLAETNGRRAKQIRSATQHAMSLSKKYGGTVFGCARLDRDVEQTTDATELNHFKTKSAAQLKDVQLFDFPLEKEVWNKIFQIKRKGTVTPLLSRQARLLWKESVSRQNNLVECSVSFSDLDFYRTGPKGWLKNLRKPNRSFRFEAQVSEFFAEPFLNAIRDEATPLLQECACLREGVRTGQVDYLVSVGGCWFPVEVKLDAGASLSENTSAQLNKYVLVDRAIPQVTPFQTRAYVLRPHTCVLLLDRRGVRVLRCSLPDQGHRVEYNLPRNDMNQENLEETVGAIRKIMGALI